MAYAYANGITTGVGDTTFGFHNTVTQEEYLTLLLRAMRYDGVDWRDPYAAADQLGLREGEDYVRDQTFQRSDMVLLSDRMLEVTLAGEEVTLYEKLDLQGALERRELPAPKLQPGPTVTVESTFAVSSVEDMIRRMAVQVDARNTALTIYTPVGQEGAYSQALLTEDTIGRGFHGHPVLSRSGLLHCGDPLPGLRPGDGLCGGKDGSPVGPGHGPL